MNVGDQIKAINKLIIQEKKQMSFRGDKVLSEKYGTLVNELQKLNILLRERGEEFEPECLSFSLVKRSSSDETVSYVRKKNPLSFLYNKKPHVLLVEQSDEICSNNLAL